jgi:soluble lytic murein transglycosylase-like protein
VNSTPGAVAPKLKIIILLMAAVAALTVAGISMTATAGATDGGLSVGGGGTGDGSSGGGSKYKRIWEDTSRKDKRWARRTSKCESGRNPDAIGGGGKYRGAFQFMKSTWRRAPKSPGGDPIKYSLVTQSVVAVKLKHREGTSAWPNCG